MPPLPGPGLSGRQLPEPPANLSSGPPSGPSHLRLKGREGGQVGFCSPRDWFSLAAGPVLAAGPRSRTTCTQTSAGSLKALSPPPRMSPSGACSPNCGSPGPEQTPNLSNLSDVIVSTHLGPRSPPAGLLFLFRPELPYSTSTCQR